MLGRMTVMISFRADEEVATAAGQWAERLGIERSELLRDALAGHLARLAAETEVGAYEAEPFRPEEVALDAADDWGPAEDWSDWAKWADRCDRAEG